MCLNKPVEKMTFVYFLRCCSSLHSLSGKPESKPEAGTACSKHDQAGPATAQTARTYPARIGLSSGGPNKDHSTIVMNGLAGRLKSLYSMLAHFGLPLNR